MARLLIEPDAARFHVETEHTGLSKTTIMRLYFFQDEYGNFGDDLNPWFWQNALGDVFDDQEDCLLVGIGTLINHRAPVGVKKITLGAGVGYGDPPTDLEYWDFQLVRGPLSAESLGLSDEHWITDPAVLVPSFLPLADVEKTHAVSFIPHHDSDRLGDWRRLCEEAGLHYISPRLQPQKVFMEIKRSHVVMTEAMHGAIIADAYRTPWIPVRSLGHFSDFKWSDWTQSMNIVTEIREIPCHFSGYKGMRLNDVLKSELKHLLTSIGMKNPRWSPPVPRRSARKTEQEIIRLLKLYSKAPPTLSDPQTLADRVDRFRQFLRQFAMRLNRNSGSETPAD